MPTELMQSLYEMNIFEQNLNYKILEGLYEDEKSAILNEAEDGKKKEGKFLTAVKFIGKQLKEFWNMIKTWWGRFVEFVTKTVPSKLREGFNKLLVILKIKEDSIVDINVKDCSEEEVKNVKKAAAIVNSQSKKTFFSKIKGVFHKEEKDEFDLSAKVNDTLDNYVKTQQEVNDAADKAMERLNQVLEHGIPDGKAATLKEAFEQHKMVFVHRGAKAEHFNGPLMDIEKINESVDTLQAEVLVKMSTEANELIQEINDCLITFNKEKFMGLSDKKVMSYQERKDDLLKYKKIYTIDQLSQDKPVKSMDGSEVKRIFNYAMQSADLIKNNSKPVEENIKDIQQSFTMIENSKSEKAKEYKPAISKLVSLTNVYLNGITACTNDMVSYFTAFQKDLLRYEVENRSNKESKSE